MPRYHSVEVKVPTPRPDPRLQRLRKERGGRRVRNEGAVAVATVYQARCWCGWYSTDLFTSKEAAYEARAKHTCS